jgi:4-hydroxymandelate oxidase
MSDPDVHGQVDAARRGGASRRSAMFGMATLAAASPLAALAQPDPTQMLSAVRRIPGLDEMQTAFDFEPLFTGNLPPSVWQFTAHGDGTEFNLRRNREAFDWVEIVRPRSPISPSQVDLSSELFGVRMKFPILVAPSSGQNGLHPDGQVGMFKAAAAVNMIDILAGATGPSVEQALKATPGGTLWAQHYPVADLDAMQRSLEGIQTAGSNCIVVTIDALAQHFERTLMVRNLGGRTTGVLGGASGAALAARAAAEREGAVGSIRYGVTNRKLWQSWAYMEAARKVIRGKMLVKGILEPDDAKLAIEYGADGVIVSNHGGRSMDYGPSTLEVLPEVVAAVNGRVPVLIDSGFRRGADVFKALALGADGVCLGRAARWGLGAFGAVGAQRVFEIIQHELVEVAAATGSARLADINGSTVRTHFT